MTDCYVPYYQDYLPDALVAHAARDAVAVEGVSGMRVHRALMEEFPGVLTTDALKFVASLYRTHRSHLRQVLEQRRQDRAFMDTETERCAVANQSHGYLDPSYQTVLGRHDADGRLVVGPHPSRHKAKHVTVPEFLNGNQVTLFGPPDTVKMSINAMNTMHRRLPNEPELVARLVRESGEVPRWGADNEDSKTPITRNLLLATQNLMGCYRGTLSLDEPERGRSYRLAKEGLAHPIKRIPGLALPDANVQVDGNPIPLHLLDFALHAFHNWSFEQGLVFYIPKLENEEEAAYLAQLIQDVESRLKQRHPSYQLGRIRLFIVFENPRAIFRIREIADALHPYFLGGSLGWHDYLASTARLFRFDPNYRIPVKADPNIVINHIRESHHILVDALEDIGALKIGGMYGILYEEGNQQSFEVSMVGYIKDVVTQLKRGLDGFWVAHPNFVRIGIALVAAWRHHETNPDSDTLRQLVAVLVPNSNEFDALWTFIQGADASGLTRDNPLYARGVLAADIEVSDVVANHHPDEVRYNIFQAVQYLTDWLCGNGCVALPATMKTAQGDPVFVRIMDDLATTERSRWELWAEVFHGRVTVDEFERILGEELQFIRTGTETKTKRIQVQWTQDTETWYPIAVAILRQLVLASNPVEFATELLMPFTIPSIRASVDPWAAVQQLCPERFTVE